MDIQFDPFSFGVATFALCVAMVQLYWNRPQHRAQVRHWLAYVESQNIHELQADRGRALYVSWSSIEIYLTNDDHLEYAKSRQRPSMSDTCLDSATTRLEDCCYIIMHVF